MPSFQNTYRVVNGEMIHGTYLQAFIKNGDIYFAVEIKVFKDGIIDCWEQVDLEGFKKKIRQGWVCTKVPNGATVSFGTPGIMFKVADVTAFVEENEFVKEVEDELRRLNGEPTSHELYYQALKKYNSEHTDEHRINLRKLYEAVPEHMRSFLGNQDDKDSEYRAILANND